MKSGKHTAVFVMVIVSVILMTMEVPVQALQDMELDYNADSETLTVTFTSQYFVEKITIEKNGVYYYSENYDISLIIPNYTYNVEVDPGDVLTVTAYTIKAGVITKSLVIGEEDNTQNQPSTVTISSPSDNANVSGVASIYGVASDADGDETIEKMEIKIGDGNWIVANGITSWSHSWNTTKGENGEYIIQARAYDGHEYSNIYSITVKVANEGEEDSNGTPGFELILLIGAIGVLLILRKRRHSRF